MHSLYQLVRSEEQPVSTWSGGTTTELAIFPQGASYAGRSFQWRLSTASVTAPASTFTALPGFQRLLMVLSGEMTLTHQGHHQLTLATSEQDRFSGAWVTHCQGTGRDFNLMLAEGWQGELQFLQLSDHEPVWRGSVGAGEVAAFYSLSGCGCFTLPPLAELLVGAGDFLLVQSDLKSARRLQIRAEGSRFELVYASIWHAR